MENPFADLLKSLEITNYKRIPFEEQCAYYAALRLDVPPVAVAKAAGVSRGTVSLLGNAGGFVSGQVRYPKVYSEWTRLGQEAFVQKYLTPPIRERLAQSMHAHKYRKRNPDINERGYNPRADRYVGRHEWLKTSLDMHVVFRISLVPGKRGYIWRNLKPFQGMDVIPDMDAPMQGDPGREGGKWGFPTSEACYRHIKRRFNPTPAQLDEAFPSITT